MSNVLQDRNDDGSRLIKDVDLITQDLKDKLDMDFWKRLWNEKQYFTNVFDLEGLPNHISSKIMNSLFFFGKIAVVKLNGKMVICRVWNENLNTSDEFVTAEASYIPPLELNVNKVAPFKKFKITPNTAVIMKWNDAGIPPVEFLGEYIGKIILLETAMITKTLHSVKTHVKTIPNDLSPIEEITLKTNSLDPSTPYIIETTAGQIGEDDFVRGASGVMNYGNGITKDISNLPLNTAHMEVLKEYIRLAYSRLGRRIEISDKKERVIVSEQAQNSASFPVLERETIRNLSEGIEGINKLFNMDIKLYAYVPQMAGQTSQEGNPSGNDGEEVPNNV